MKAMNVLYPLLSLDSAPSTQAAAVWAIGTLAAGIPEIQNATRTLHGGRFLKAIVLLLESKTPQVQHQAANAVYNIAVRNTENQSAIAELQGIEKLVVLMHSNKDAPKSVEKVVAALLCLVLKHPKNQQLLVRSPPAFVGFWFFVMF